MPYFPPPHPAWDRAEPAPADLDPAAMTAAARHAAEHETPWRRDLLYMVEHDFDEEPPWNEALGPVRPRGAALPTATHAMTSWAPTARWWRAPRPRSR